MTKQGKLLEQMRSNPKKDWTIKDIETVCRQLEYLDVRLTPPRRGSHYTVSHDTIQEILTIPARRPIKPVYVKRFVSIIDSIMELAENERR